MSGAHWFYIPLVLLVGVVIGFLLKGVVMRDATAEPRHRTRLSDD